ncbi:enoyl-CoA hydratase/isomerase family protein [Actinomadura geliboluensis]|uniref:Enoyl-CoA hydratase/isomerase family protein n=1 Tax=Actinomadura geliboluensis TaxID=882440 RepID=A0A5S4H6C5_9ACTN|nr:enoyl-CoA hydratase/isomerase family protein [Actinomadura geliboluensis]TMR40636.1 enoyl-CoA hydratase/isomerase family protein [Actinomadura geliboluensis]
MTARANVTLEVGDGVAWVRLNRPAALNAYSAALLDDLNDTLDDIEDDPRVRVLVVTGTGRAFSTGGDLKYFRSLLDTRDHDGLLAYIDYSAKTLTRFEELPKPVIAAVNGVTVAGGLELVLCCDLVIASADARIGDGHLKYGVLPGAGGSARLVRKVPANVASRLLLTGELFEPGYLQRHGLIDEVVPPDRLIGTAAAMARRLAELSPLALREVKRVAREAATQSSAIGLKLELGAFTTYVASEDFNEGMTAFTERRAPIYRGR